MLRDLKEKVWQANLELVRLKLVTLTWGNVSGVDRKKGLVAIKPSGVSYEELKPSDVVLIDLEGKCVEGSLVPSSDTPTHLELYKAFPDIAAVAHTHSEYAAIFAQAGHEIPCLGTTHADVFYGPVPVTRFMRRAEVEHDYEKNTGRVIIERFQNLSPADIPGVLVAGHGAFTWGKTPGEAVENSLALEKIAKMAFGTLLLSQRRAVFPRYLLEKHHQRKHGPGAYYGQKRGGKR
ncbi:MAG: L-ribulose-5-phosphate 4-epimerase AraD [Clostridiales bacterium]|nr:L-ribulose-5-phosphate 4-epimerase AraD [Clostridiales bacterium]